MVRSGVALSRNFARQPVVSALLFATARQVVADQDLLRRAEDLSERRTAFLREMRDILADMDTVEVASREQFNARELASRRSSGR